MNYKFSQPEQSFVQSCNNNLAFNPIKDCHSNSDDDALSYDILFTNFEKEYGILLNYENNLLSIPQAINSFHKLVFHSQFQLNNIFLREEFADALSFITVSQSFDTKNMCLEIIGNLWNSLNNTSTPLTSEKIINTVVGFCTPGYSNQHDILPNAFFAVANLCAMSKNTRDMLISLNIIYYLDKYLTQQTCHRQVYSGLRLSFNLLVYGVDDIWNLIAPLICKIRFHTLNIDLKNRALAARCLILITKNTEHIKECLKQNVHSYVFKSITENINFYCNDIFDLATRFIQAGIFDNFLTLEFVEYCNSFLDRCDNINDASSFFILLTELIPQINQLLIAQGTIYKIIRVANNGSFENMKSATFLLIKFLKTVDSKTSNKIADNGAFEAFCNLVGVTLDPSDLLNILESIYHFLLTDKDVFLNKAFYLDLENSLNLCEVEDEICNKQLHLILSILSQSNDNQ